MCCLSNSGYSGTHTPLYFGRDLPNAHLACFSMESAIKGTDPEVSRYKWGVLDAASEIVQIRADVLLMKPLLFIFKQAAAFKSAAAPQIILSMFNTLLLDIFIVPGSNASARLDFKHTF